MPRESREFRLTEQDDRLFGGCHLLGHIHVPPKVLVGLFGPPNEGDGYKVSGEYYFEDPEDYSAFYYVYDWKSTTLYESEALRPSELWEMESDYDFHIGGKNTEALEDFKFWLQQKIKENL